MKIQSLEKKEFKNNLPIYYATIPTKFGQTTIAILEEKVIHVSFEQSDLFKRFPKAIFIEDKALCKGYLDALFDCEDVTVLLIGTKFQLLVWLELSKISKGSLHTYEQIAYNIGNPKAIRAVGTAIGANPIGYFIPCHRVVRKNGDLGGFKWGLELKSMMIEMEMFSGN